MKRLLAAICFFSLLIPLSLSRGKVGTAANFPVPETLKFQLKYLHMNVATLTFHLTESPRSCTAYSLTVDAKATAAANRLFPTDNRYDLSFGKANFLPSFVEKKIVQKNVRYRRFQKFDHTSGEVAVDDTFRYAMPEPCFDYFSMLYFLRFALPNSQRTTKLFLDGEFLVSEVTVIRLPDTVRVSVPVGQFSATQIRLKFADRKEQKRPWKTDLLTNRLTKPGSDVFIFLSADDRRLPLKITYRNSWVRTALELVEF